MYCKNCGNALNEGAQVCLRCGVDVKKGNRFCANCGAEHDPAASVCLKCGVALKGGSGNSSETMSYIMALVKDSYKKSFTLSGRTSRKDFWYFYAFAVVLSMIVMLGLLIVSPLLGVVTAGYGTILLLPLSFALPTLVSIAVGIPMIGLCTRRMHDIGKSGWFSLLYWLGPLLCFIPNVVYIVFACKAGDEFENEYGAPNN